MQQISLSQRVTKNEIEAKMGGFKNGIKSDKEALKDGLKLGTKGLKDGLKEKMEGLKEGLTHFLQEILPNGEKILDETHDENKRNVNHDFTDSNVGLKSHHIPNIDMRKFDGNDLVTWILQMEKYFDFHNVQNTQKVHISTLYLEPNQFVWYRWLFSHKQIVTWSIFMEEMMAHYENTKRNNFFIELINHKTKGFDHGAH